MYNSYLNPNYFFESCPGTNLPKSIHDQESRNDSVHLMQMCQLRIQNMCMQQLVEANLICLKRKQLISFEMNLQRQSQCLSHHLVNCTIISKITKSQSIRRISKKEYKQDEERREFGSPMSFDSEMNDTFQQTFIKFGACKLLDRIGNFLSKKEKLFYRKMWFLTIIVNKTRIILIRRFKIFYIRHHLKNQSNAKIFGNLYRIFLSMSRTLLRQLEKRRKSVTQYSNQRKKPDKQSNLSKKFNISTLTFVQESITLLYHFNIEEWHHVRTICRNYGINMWILKQTGVSRGSGITITSHFTKITQLRYGKIVQKQLEHPLLLNCKRKFDIRQWVLVTSFFSLKADAFKQCYARVSSAKYSNDKYDKVQQYLTNYSQIKESYL